MLKKDYLLAIDIGTQSSRAALVDLDGGIVASSAQTYDLDNPAPGWAQQDARLWWNATAYNIRTILESSGISPHRIVAVAAGAQMHATIPLSNKGEVLTPAVQLWCDKRNAGLVDELGKNSEISDAFDLVGNLPSPAWLGLKIKWVQANQPEVYEKTWKFVTGSGYITYQLTGVATIDPSEASGSFLMDARRGTWALKMFDVLGLDRDKLPDIYDSASAAGTISAEAARYTGLARGTPVAAGAGDMMTTLLAAGLTQLGRAIDSTGTASIMAIYSDKPILDRRLMNLHHAMPGWVPFGIVETGGGALKWFKDGFCQEESQEGFRTGRSAYQLLDEKAAQVAPGAEGLLFFPYLLGERTLGSPYSRGVFFGLTPRSGKGAMARAVMEGIVFEMRRTLEIVEKTGTPVTEIRTVGGGAQSPLWCQIRADIYQKPLVTLKTFEGGTLGSAMLAGVAAGMFPDVRTAAEKFVKVDKILQPNPVAAERYDRLFELFKDLHDRMQGPFNAISAIH